MQNHGALLGKSASRCMTSIGRIQTSASNCDITNPEDPALSFVVVPMATTESRKPEPQWEAHRGLPRATERPSDVRITRRTLRNFFFGGVQIVDGRSSQSRISAMMSGAAAAARSKAKGLAGSAWRCWHTSCRSFAGASPGDRTGVGGN